MSTTLKIDNFPALNILETTALDAALNPGDTSVTLVSNQGIAVNDFILINTPGAEASDLIKVQTLVGNTGITAATAVKYRHNRFDPVSKLLGDQIKIYTAPNVTGYQPDDTAFAALAGGIVSIDPDQSSTTFTDVNGDNTKWYKHVFINSLSLVETPLASTGAVRGAGYGAYCTTDLIRQKASLSTNRWITDEQVAEARGVAQSEVDAQLSGLYKVPFTTTVNPLIKNITALLAAGVLLTDAYGQNSTGTNKDGEAKMADARATLERIKSKDLILNDILGNETAVSSSNTVSSWPDSTTADLAEADGGSQRMFRAGHQY